MEALSLLNPVKFKESLPTVTTSTLVRSCTDIERNQETIKSNTKCQEACKEAMHNDMTYSG
jgi:hypothetical protein